MTNGNASAEQRKLAAIMFTDMVGYSALAQRDDKLALELLEEHRRLLREIFPRFHGTEIKTIGDAFLVEFSSALEAAQCAIEIQRTLAKRNHDVAAERRIELKIGIHIGDVVHREGDVYGDGVNIASRIEPLAGAGGICVSMDVERQIRNALEARFEKLAPTDLKNISVPMDLFRIVLPWEQRIPFVDKFQGRPRPSARKFAVPIIAVLLLLLIGVGWWWTMQPHKKHTEAANMPAKSIAVLPFDNLSRDPDNAFFAEGVQDEILTRLAKVADLKVIARSSTQKFKSSPENLPDIAKQLGVLNVLEGSVQKVNDQVRVNVQLINAMTNAHLWAETYDRKLTDIFSVESDIAKTIADTLQAKLTGAEKSVIAKHPTESTEAHQLYLKGRFFWNKRTPENFEKAITYFQQAIEKDSSYALAYSGVADCYALLANYTARPPNETMPKAKAAALRALQIDSNLAEAHASLAQIVHDYDWDYAGALREIDRAIELNPNYATAHQWRAEFLSPLERHEEAIAEAKRALELDPLSIIVNRILGEVYLHARQYDEAITQFRKTIEIEPNFPSAHVMLARAYAAKGQYSEAVAGFIKTVELDGMLGTNRDISTEFRDAYAKGGWNGYLHQFAEIGKAETTSGYKTAYFVAATLAQLGEKDEAFAWLEKAYQERDYRLTQLKVAPELDNLRSDPRFTDLLRRLGLAQ
jgi:adenylate cyclase